MSHFAATHKPCLPAHRTTAIPSAGMDCNETSVTTPQTNPLHQLLRRSTFLLIGGLLIANIIAFVLQNAVALPSSDQWDLHEPVWRDASVWTLIHHQHGPHRQGVFFPLTAEILQLAHGDIRVESLWIALWLILGGVLAWWLPRRFFGRWHWTDMLPLACGLSLLPNETLTTTPNLSHSIGPLVLVLLAAHALLVEQVWLRWVLLGLIGPALTFTGFGLFGSVVLLALGLITALRRGPERWPAALATGMLTAGWLLFFCDYRFEPAAPGYQFPHFPLWDYGPFLMAMLSTPHGFTSPAQPGLMIGGLLLLIGGTALVSTVTRLYRPAGDRRRDCVLVLLLGTSLLFAANTAIGRVQLGEQCGMASRYLSLLLPLTLALFLLARGAASTAVHHAGLIALAGLALWPYRDLRNGSGSLGTWGLPRAALAEVHRVREAKLGWLWAYSDSFDTEKAGTLVRLEPNPPAAKLARLQSQHWAPFRLGPRPADYAPFAGSPAVLPVGLYSRDEEGQRWMPAQAFLVADGRRGRWLNIEIHSRIPSLPTTAPLVVEFKGRRLGFEPGTITGLSLPLSDSAAQVARLSSPAGARRPVDDGASTDTRELSFSLGRLTVDAVPLYASCAPLDERTWTWQRAITKERGLHGWENGFAWMAAGLELTVESTVPTQLHIGIGGRFSGLPGAGGLEVSVDGAPETPASLDQNKGTLLIGLHRPGRHTINLRSEDGARSPQACSLSSDARELSYRITALKLEAAAPLGEDKCGTSTP